MRRILESEALRRFVFLAVLLAAGCAVSDPPCEKGALGIEAGAMQGDGVAIAEVLPGGPADLAGIRRGDVLVSVGGVAAHYACQVPGMVFHRACAPLPVVVTRDGARIEKSITPVDEGPLYDKGCKAGDPAACYRAAWLAGASYKDACTAGSAEA